MNALPVGYAGHKALLTTVLQNLCHFPYLSVVPGADWSVEGRAVQPLLSADMSEAEEDVLRLSLSSSSTARRLRRILPLAICRAASECDDEQKHEARNTRLPSSTVLSQQKALNGKLRIGTRASPNI